MILTLPDRCLVKSENFQKEESEFGNFTCEASQIRTVVSKEDVMSWVEFGLNRTSVIIWVCSSGVLSVCSVSMFQRMTCSYWKRWRVCSLFLYQAQYLLSYNLRYSKKFNWQTTDSCFRPKLSPLSTKNCPGNVPPTTHRTKIIMIQLSTKMISVSLIYQVLSLLVEVACPFTNYKKHSSITTTM